MFEPASNSRLAYFLKRGWLFLSKGPVFAWLLIRWYGFQMMRRIGVRRKPWHVEQDSIWSQIRINSPWKEQLASAVELGDSEGACAVVQRYFQQRSSPRFFFGIEDRDDLCRLITPAQRAGTLVMVSQTIRREFAFRGQDPVVFPESIDWTFCPEGNVDWMWDLNRLFFLVDLGKAFWYSGQEKHARTFVEMANDWLQKNPVDEENPVWRSPFEVTIRIGSLLWAYFLFLQTEYLDAKTHQRLIWGLWEHGTFLCECLELHVPNNHLLLEAKSLLMLSILFPEFCSASRWRRRSSAILERELKRQILRDGTHVERVPHYHRLVAGELLELLVLLENNRIEAPAQLVSSLAKMIEFELYISRPDGKFPLFGDSAHDDLHIRFSPLIAGAALLNRSDWKPRQNLPDEMTSWMLGPRRVQMYLDMPSRPPVPSRLFPDGGFAIMRDKWDRKAMFLAMDCGPFGYALASGHGHADALGLVAHAGGHELLVDAGVYSFHLGERWRNWFRSTRAHNTVVVDDCNQSLLIDEWRVWRPARSVVRDWVTHPDLDLIVAHHDGYCRLSSKIVHIRTVVYVKPEYWIVIDYLDGKGEHNFELLFHLPIYCSPVMDPQTKRVLTSEMAIIPLNRPGLSASLSEAWLSPRSGEKKLAPVVCYQQKVLAPVVFQTVLYPLSLGADDVPAVTPLDPLAKQYRGADDLEIGLVLDSAGKKDIMIVDKQYRRQEKTCGRYETDAALAVLRFQDNWTQRRLLLRNGTYFRKDGLDLLEKACGSCQDGLVVEWCT